MKINVSSCKKPHNFKENIKTKKCTVLTKIYSWKHKNFFRKQSFLFKDSDQVQGNGISTINGSCYRKFMFVFSNFQNTTYLKPLAFCWILICFW